MHKSAIYVFSLALVVLMALVLNPAAASAEKVLYVSADPNELGVTTFNPLKVELSHDAMWVLYDRFVEMGLDNQFYPGLAESWVISSDGLVWKMKLKKGVKFHDGTSFDAEVAKWFLKEMENGPSAYMVGAIDRVEINDPHSITIHMKHAEPNMLFNFSQNFMAVPSISIGSPISLRTSGTLSEAPRI